MNQFCRLQLRTNNVSSARAFYDEILGDQTLDIIELPAVAVARGAPAHWLGYVGVEDLEQRVEAFISRGATRVGAMQYTGDKGRAVVLRDPAGVIVGLATPPVKQARTRPVWHELYAVNAEKVASHYCEVFGWELKERMPPGSAVHQRFAWRKGASSAGSIADIAGSASVHPH